mmetsp:Transcript_6713/g.20334  ORF Transcript_6713/g.20334 Transcript_6713/m.20334 type:complete len:83 (-) Transcript_6713:1810-2058(-)
MADFLGQNVLQTSPLFVVPVPSTAAHIRPRYAIDRQLLSQPKCCLKAFSSVSLFNYFERASDLRAGQLCGIGQKGRSAREGI